MRGFSRQLSLKHQYLKQAEEEEGESLKEAKKELDQWIDLEMFLNVADIEPRSVKVWPILHRTMVEQTCRVAAAAFFQ